MPIRVGASIPLLQGSHFYTVTGPIYEQHFSWYRNKSLTFLEIGVARGGSLQMWQRVFGPLAKIVGIDIQERSKSYEAPGGAFVRIGDQADEQFLQSLIDEFGVPDVVLDDGSHQMEHISKTFNFLYPEAFKEWCLYGRGFTHGLLGRVRWRSLKARHGHQHLQGLHRSPEC
jgi:hypothetical protein